MEANRQIIIEALGNSVDQENLKKFHIDEDDLLNPKEAIARIKMGIDTDYLVRHIGGDNFEESFLTQLQDDNQEYTSSIASNNVPSLFGTNDEQLHSLQASKRKRDFSPKPSGASINSFNKF